MRSPNVRLAELMRLAACSNSGLASRVRAVGAEHGVELRCDHVSVKRWLDGMVPRGLMPQFIAEALSRKLSRPVSLHEVGMELSTTGQALVTAAYPDAIGDSIRSMAALVCADSGGITPSYQVDPAAWSDVMVRWLVAPDGVAPLRVVDSPDLAVEAVHRSTDLFSQLDYRFGGGYARGALVAFVHGEFLPLMERYGVKAPSELLRAGAALLRLTGWTAYDVGQHGLSMRYLTQALRFAQAGEDRALGGRILAGMSHQANYLGHHGQAVNFARAAQRGAERHATSTAMALFCCMEARAHAARGDRAQCEQALLDARSWFERRRPEDDPTWLRYFDEAELAAEFAHCYRDLGMSGRAVTYATEAIDASDPLYARSILFCRSVLVAGRVGRGEVDEGLSLAVGVFEAAVGVRSGRVQAYLRDMVERLKPHATEAPVRDFIERSGVALDLVRIG